MNRFVKYKKTFGNHQVKVFAIYVSLTSILFGASHSYAEEKRDCKSDRPLTLEDILNQNGDQTSGRTFKEFQTPAVDLSNVDERWRKHVENLQKEIITQDLDIVAPDYNEALQQFRQSSVDRLNRYFRKLDLIRTETESTLVSLFSKLKSFKENADRDNTGIINEAYRRELQRTRNILGGLQIENQKRYSAALMELEVIPNSETFDTSSSTLTSLRNLEETKKQVKSLKKEIEDINQLLGSSKFVKKSSDRFVIYPGCGNYYSAERSECRRVEEKLESVWPTQKRIWKLSDSVYTLEKLTADVRSNPFRTCKTFICTQLLKQDVITWRNKMDRYLVDIDQSKIIKSADHFLNPLARGCEIMDQQLGDKAFCSTLNMKNTLPLSTDWFRSPIPRFESDVSIYATSLPNALFKENKKEEVIVLNNECPNVPAANEKIINTPQGSSSNAYKNIKPEPFRVHSEDLYQNAN